jgi:hypothetical protein
MDGKRPPERLTPRDASNPPTELVRGLKRLWQPVSVLDWPNPKQTLVDWGPGAQEVYLAFSREMDKWEGVDGMKYHLGMRVCESSVRLATIVACLRGSQTVDREDIEWALKLGQRSFDTACSDYPKYVKEYFEFPVFCRKIYEALLVSRMSDYEVHRKFGRNQRGGTEVERALSQLQKERRIRWANWRSGERGRLKEGWEAIRDDDE